METRPRDAARTRELILSTAKRHFALHGYDRATVPLARYLGGTDAPERAAAVSSLIMGTVIQRYVLGIGPLAATTSDGARAWLGTALQLLLTGGSFSPLARPAAAS